ncbi:chorismate-binding protein, partial [Shimia sp.]|uniref:chorismate-binding protein n=1 Tax=Shimia sp. TaxID=1954381 RepID=UPI00356395F3
MGADLEIRFDHGPEGRAAEFRAARGMVVAETPAEVPAALAALDRARRDGFWLAGYASYELGYALEPRLAARMPARRRLPLIRFGLYDAPAAAGPLPPGGFTLGQFTPRWSAAQYGAAFARVHELIGAGDIYQANLTFPLEAPFSGDPRALYAALAAQQPVGHGALVLQDGLPDLLSRSPELFFRTDASGRIETRPMKGTQPRSADPAEDA